MVEGVEGRGDPAGITVAASNVIVSTSNTIDSGDKAGIAIAGPIAKLCCVHDTVAAEQLGTPPMKQLSVCATLDDPSGLTSAHASSMPVSTPNPDRDDTPLHASLFWATAYPPDSVSELRRSPGVCGRVPLVHVINHSRSTLTRPLADVETTNDCTRLSGFALVCRLTPSANAYATSRG